MTATTPTLERQRPIPASGGPTGRGGGPRGGGGDEYVPIPATSPARIAVWLLVGAITILFVAFTSTYLVRRAEADWRVGPLPPVLWMSTGIILLSSATLELARRQARWGRMAGLHAWLTVTTLLGAAFLAGQVTAWRQLAAAGIFLATNPHAAFFYLLTGAHGMHLIGGIGALVYTVRKVPAAETPAEALDIADPVATYWHFLAGLWVFLFIVLFAL